MKSYIEITVLPDVDVSEAFLISKTMQRLHISFVKAAEENDGKYVFGISLPKYDNSRGVKNPIGNKIRIFSDHKENFSLLKLEKLLERIGDDYLHITSIRSVPERRIKCYAVYSRIHADHGLEKSARRYAKRHDISYEKALERYKVLPDECSEPYINMKSSSNGGVFKIFIKKVVVEKESLGEYNSYGLSSSVTVPEF